MSGDDSKDQIREQLVDELADILAEAVVKDLEEVSGADGEGPSGTAPLNTAGDPQPNARHAPSIPREVARHLGYYMYLYVDPRSDTPFYVGKGQGQRVLSHLSARAETRKARVLAELRAAGLEPRLEVLAHALPNEEMALRIEAAVIDLLRLDHLTNKVRGWRSVQLGRIPLSELITYYAARPVHVRDPMLLIRINRLYRHGMTANELYEATRGVWKLGRRRNRARFAAAVFEAVIREAYEIESWHPAGTTTYETREQKTLRRSGRVEFLGRIAPEQIRTRYVGRSVEAYFKRGLQSPVVYANS